jgi:DNA-binding response OmpR family regulator
MKNGAESQRILIVDDEKDITDVLEVGLARHGYRIEAFNDPVEALKHFKGGRYDFAIFDIRMPNMNGFELYRAIRKEDENIAICFFSAFEIATAEFEKVFPEIRAQVFLKKPMAIAELAKRIGSLLAEPQSEDAAASA